MPFRTLDGSAEKLQLPTIFDIEKMEGITEWD